MPLGEILKALLIPKLCCAYFVGNLWKNLGIFLLQHMVTLSTSVCALVLKPLSLRIFSFLILCKEQWGAWLVTAWHNGPPWPLVNTPASFKIPYIAEDAKKLEKKLHLEIASPWRTPSLPPWAHKACSSALAIPWYNGIFDMGSFRRLFGAFSRSTFPIRPP